MPHLLMRLLDVWTLANMSKSNFSCSAWCIEKFNIWKKRTGKERKINILTNVVLIDWMLLWTDLCPEYIHTHTTRNFHFGESGDTPLKFPRLIFLSSPPPPHPHLLKIFVLWFFLSFHVFEKNYERIWPYERFVTFVTCSYMILANDNTDLHRFHSLLIL